MNIPIMYDGRLIGIDNQGRLTFSINVRCPAARRFRKDFISTTKRLFFKVGK